VSSEWIEHPNLPIRDYEFFNKTPLLAFSMIILMTKWSFSQVSFSSSKAKANQKAN
jgi:hypothetical protein